MPTASCFLGLIQRGLGVWGQDSTCQKESLEKAISEQGCGRRVHTLGTVTSYSLPTVHSSSRSRWASCWRDARQQGDLKSIQASGLTSLHQRFRVPTWSGQGQGCGTRENCTMFPANPGFLHPVTRRRAPKSRLLPEPPASQLISLRLS